MNKINLLIQLANTPDYCDPLNQLLTNQPTEIREALLGQNIAAVKALFVDPSETFTNERTVTQFYIQ